MTRSLSLILAAFIPRTTPNCESLCATDEAVECIEGRTVDHRRLISDQHALDIVEGIDDHRTGITKSNLEDTCSILPPPRLTNSSMVIAELEEVASEGERTRNFGNAFNEGYVGSS